ncbi:MAG TPA: PHP-associated domain-containing protein [Terriglobia bacterium]|nr:PHP-associated domain-containing protein [Terriglobia bacterium]
MHVHSYFSGKTNHVRPLEPMDCYSTPERVYKLAKTRGMDLVTITDHDSIDGCLDFLNRFPDRTKDFFIGEEVTTCLTEFRTNIHIGVYDITETQHREITRLKKSFDDLVAYLKSNQIIYVLNHFFLGFPQRQHGRRFMEKMLQAFDLFEAINGAISNKQNQLLTQMIPKIPGKAMVAGSDSHTLLRLGSCYTLGQGRTKKEFLDGLRAGRVGIVGKNSRFIHVFNDAMGVYLAYFRDIAYRNEVHRNWSLVKKIRNGLGWAGWLPVFFSLSLTYSFIHYRQEEKKQGYYEGLLREFL